MILFEHLIKNNGYSLLRWLFLTNILKRRKEINCNTEKKLIGIKIESTNQLRGSEVNRSTKTTKKEFFQY